jgi:chitinase
MRSNLGIRLEVAQHWTAILRRSTLPYRYEVSRPGLTRPSIRGHVVFVLVLWVADLSFGQIRSQRKRSLDDVNGNHKRWLEDEWRDDLHHGALSRADLHKRWFGSDVLDWLKGLFNPSITQEFKHTLDTTFTAKLIEESRDCNIKGVDVEANLLVEALTDVHVSTSFGLTIITTLSLPLDLSQSYLYFKNEGSVSAVFTLDALGRAAFSREVELLNLANFPGATFSIPKLVTIGPNFRLMGQVDADITLAGHVESRANIASWSVQQTWPDQSSEYDPKLVDGSIADLDGTGSFQGISRPTFDYSVDAIGTLSAHLKPTFEFGIAFDPSWGVGKAVVDVVADGFVQLQAQLSTSSNSPTCPFTYGLNVGASLYATVDAPKAFGWGQKSFPLSPSVHKAAIQAKSCPQLNQKRSTDAFMQNNSLSYHAEPFGYHQTSDTQLGSTHRLQKRTATYGPPIKLPKLGCLYCPSIDSDDPVDCANVRGFDDDQYAQDQDLMRRSEYALEKRGKVGASICNKNGEGAKMGYDGIDYDSTGDIILAS